MKIGFSELPVAWISPEQRQFEQLELLALEKIAFEVVFEIERERWIHRIHRLALTIPCSLGSEFLESATSHVDRGVTLIGLV